MIRFYSLLFFVLFSSVLAMIHGYSLSRIKQRVTEYVLTTVDGYTRKGRIKGIGHGGSSCSTRLFGGGKIRDGLGKAKGYSDANSRYILDRQTKSGLPDRTKPFLVLGIESSCDDTGAAIVRSDGTVLSNVVYSQYEIHERFGGIVPSLAMEAHKVNIDKAVAEALAQAGLSSMNDVDAIAVTKGPGLEICLRVGFKKAQQLARESGKPFVTVHHLEAHCVMARLAGKEIVAEESASTTTPAISDNNNINNVATAPARTDNNEFFMPKVAYPFLALLASGGHTSILLCKDMGEYSVLGGTLDDALGEAFDKAARLLGLATTTSGGAAVEAAARLGNRKEAYGMTVPMRSKPNCDFSYAGLKNAFRVAVQRARELEGLDVESTNAPPSQMEVAPVPVALSSSAAADLCATFQDVAFTHVEDRISRALNYLEDQSIDVNALVVVGGVAANKALRQRLLTLLASRNNYNNYNSSNNNNNNTNHSGNNTNNLKTDNDNDNENEISDVSPFSSSQILPLSEPLSSSTPQHPPRPPIPLVFPPVNLCTDNGVMVAWAGIEKLLMGISDEVEGQEVVARWPLGSPIDNGNPVFIKRKKSSSKSSSTSSSSSNSVSSQSNSSNGSSINSASGDDPSINENSNESSASTTRSIINDSMVSYPPPPL